METTVSVDARKDDDLLKDVAQAMYHFCDTKEAAISVGITLSEMKALIRRPRYREVMRIMVDGASGHEESRIFGRLANVAFRADVADFEPVLRGEKTLEDLRAEGVDTRCIKAVATKGSRITRVELHDPLKAIKTLAELAGIRKDPALDSKNVIDQSLDEAFGE